MSLDRFKGFDLLSLLVWARDPDRGDIPTRAGLAVRVELLPELLAILQEAERQAHRAGFLAAHEGVADG